METDSVVLEGTVESVVYQNTDTGFAVLDFSCNGELFTAVGTIPGISSGEKIKAKGSWAMHPSFGRQFRIDECTREMPETAGDMYTYLSSGIIKGVKERTAAKIVEKFGERSFDVIENDPKLLSTVSGITLKRAKEISLDFKLHFGAREVLISLEKFGIKATQSLKIYKIFGDGSVEMVRSNPYILCESGIGISFDKAEEIALSLPAPSDPYCRICAGILHVMRHNLANGHTCIPRSKLLAPCSDFLSVSEDVIEVGIDKLIETKRLVSAELSGRDKIFLPELYESEYNCAARIRFMSKFTAGAGDETAALIDTAEVQGGICYNDKQRLAIRIAVEKGILVLTGGPGTGKTTVLRGILNVFEKSGLRVALAAPTGRAAKRMSELTGKEAMTIHRMLEVEWDETDNPTFTRGRRNPIEANAVIVDELSMVDVRLFSGLLDALPIGCRLIMVGDSDQIPPVGAGNVLHDLIDSGVLPVVALDEVFRQSGESLIVSNAHRIVRGEMPELAVTDRDFFFMNRIAPNAASSTVVDLCISRLPAAYNYSVFNEIQIICPSRMGECGTVNINNLIQAAVNPPSKKKRELRSPSLLLREGDKVMQIKNNYDIDWTDDFGNEGLGVFNGDIGILEKVDNHTRHLVVRFDDRVCNYPFESAKELELAYAVTVHKSQGNEFTCVVMPVCGVPEKLAYRNLFYTAVTRARENIILVGSSEVIRHMVENNVKSKRYSALREFLLLS